MAFISSMEPVTFSDKNDKTSSQQRLEISRKISMYTLLSLILLLLSAVGLAVLFGLYYVTKQTDYEYGIVIDAGSSHTTLYLYKWNSAKVNDTGLVEQVSACAVAGGGISDYVKAPEEAGNSLRSCLDDAKANLSWVIRQYTPVYLGATAGMRLVQMANPDAADAIIKAIQKVMAEYPFQLTNINDKIKILSGQEEGIGLWITSNYVAGTIGDVFENKWFERLPAVAGPTITVLDLGGASTQVSFAMQTNQTQNIPPPYQEKITLFSKDMSLFSDSFLCYGANEMKRVVNSMLAQDNNYSGNITHPCWANGYNKTMTYLDVFGKSPCTSEYSAKSVLNTTMTLIGGGNRTECAKLVSRLFNRTYCPFSSCSFEGRPMPSINVPMLARGSYAYVMNDLKVLNSSKKGIYADFVNSMDSFCLKNNSELDDLKKKGMYDPYNVCLNAHYVDYILTKIYNVTQEEWQNIVFSNKINEIDMNWPFGYMTNITSSLPKVPRLSLFHISDWVFGVVLALLSILLIIGLAFAVLSCKYRNKHYEAV